MNWQAADGSGSLEQLTTSADGEEHLPESWSRDGRHLLVSVLKDGPAVGVHTLVWCDSLTNLMRTFERGTLKEFELLEQLLNSAGRVVTRDALITAALAIAWMRFM